MEYICKYCNKSCKNINSLKQHERLCKLNPDRCESPFVKFNKQRRHAWNKGLTKDTDVRVKRNAESVSKSYTTGKSKVWCKGLSKETDYRIKQLSEKISNTILEHVKNNNWHNSFGKSKIVEYNGIKFHGTWEVEFAKFLTKHHIKWERPVEKFEYPFYNKTHYYTPDFYLPDLDLFIEIKGYPTERDFNKWENFPKDKNLNIYFGDDLFELGIISDYKKVYDNIPLVYREKMLLF